MVGFAGGPILVEVGYLLDDPAGAASVRPTLVGQHLYYGVARGVDLPMQEGFDGVGADAIVWVLGERFDGFGVCRGCLQLQGFDGICLDAVVAIV